MPGKFKCNSCGGVYPDTTGAGNVAYFHACPDEIVNTPEITDGTHAITTPVSFKPTPNPRNENLKPDPANPGKFIPISVGLGVTPI